MAENKSNDDYCCGCCVGLAVGYLLWHNSSAQTIENKQAIIKDATNITRLVEDKNSSHNFLLKQIQNYQKNISPRIKEELGTDKLCKFTPSCSEYAKEAIEKYGSLKGSLMAIGRLARCNPLSDGKYDPVQ